MFTLSNNQLSTISPEHQERISHLLNNSKASNTITAYQSDWKDFTSFCEQNNLAPLPVSEATIATYISEQSKTHKLSTIKRKLSSINKAHTTAHLPSPTNTPLIKEIIAGLAREKGTKQTPKQALVLDDLKRLIDVIDVSTLAGKRDKALLLVGYATASRRSELVSIDTNHITFTNEGMDIEIFQEKTQQWIVKSIIKAKNSFYCPVNNLEIWLIDSNIKTGAIFRQIKHDNVYERLSDKTVANTIKKYCELAGLDPALYSGHSLRSGMATSAAKKGFHESAIMKQTGHNTNTMVQRYIQEANRYENNVTSIFNQL
jgi:site-specific recombinase XerD